MPDHARRSLPERMRHPGPKRAGKAARASSGYRDDRASSRPRQNVLSWPGGGSRRSGLRSPAHVALNGVFMSDGVVNTFAVTARSGPLVARIWGLAGLCRPVPVSHRLSLARFVAAGTLWIGAEGIAGLLLIAVVFPGQSADPGIEGHDLDGKQAISFGPHLATGLWWIWVLGQQPV